jgi:hypothetical protein
MRNRFGERTTMFIIKINCVVIWTKFSDKSGWYDSGPKGETCIGLFLTEESAQEFLDENGFKYKRKQIGPDEKTGTTIWHAEIKKIHTIPEVQDFSHPALPKPKILD